MRKTLLAVGKIRDKWLQAGIDEYIGRLKRFGRLEIIEIPDEKVPEKFSEKEIAAAVEREGEKLLSRWPAGAAGVALHPAGNLLGSEGLAQYFETAAVGGISHLVFVVGGSNGLPDSVLRRCDRAVSFGPNTFPHQLFRLMLLEQIYRAEKIRAGETYHK